MKYLKEYTLLALALLMASCSSDNDTIEISKENNNVPATSSMSFSASIDSKVTGDMNGKATRTTLSSDANPYPLWSKGDQIKIFNTATSDAKLFSISDGDENKSAATFTGEINTASTGNKFYAVYAGGITASGKPTLALSGNKVTVSGNIPSSQSTTAGFHPELHFMTAYTEGSTFHFRNGMALMKVTIADNNYNNFKICKIVLKSNNESEAIAGDFTADIANTNKEATKEDPTSYKVGDLINYTVTNGSSEITIGDGKSALAVGTYYIAILPCAFSNGFTLSFLDERLDVNNDPNCKQYDRIKSTSYSVAASEIINLGTYTAKECAKEAYVDLGLTRTINGVSKKILFCIENVYDDETGKTSDVNSSYYAWGETLVKANLEKYSDEFKSYSWYYDYNFGSGSQHSDNSKKRSYLYGVGASNWNAFTASESYSFKYLSSTGLVWYTGVLLKYNDNSSYRRSSGDWTGGSIDNDTELDELDDAAYLRSPQKILRIPSEDDFNALMNGVKDKKLVKGDAKGMTGFFKFKKNETGGNYILLPKGGYRFKSDADDDNEPKNDKVSCCYWTRDRSTGTDSDGHDVSFKARSFVVDGTNYNTTVVGDVQRAQGRMIRAVIYR